MWIVGETMRSLCRVLALRSTQASVLKPVVRRIRTDFNQSPEDKEDSAPVPFSTSKGSHRVWTVARSLGSDYQRPWWTVLPFSLLSIAFLLWCVFRKDTEVDKSLEALFNSTEIDTADKAHNPKKDT